MTPYPQPEARRCPAALSETMNPHRPTANQQPGVTPMQMSSPAETRKFTDGVTREQVGETKR